MRALSLPAALGAALALAAAPAPPPDPRPDAAKPVAQFQEIVRVDLVQLNFLAIDSRGRPVSDLKPEEVEVFEGRAKQKIVFLQPYYTPRRDSPAAPAPSAETAPRPGVPDTTPPGPGRGPGALSPGRWIVLFFDNSTASPATRIRALEAARQFVTTGVHQGDQVAVIVFDGKPEMLQSFTSDAGLLEAAVLKASRGSERAAADRYGAVASLLDELDNCRNAGESDACATRYGGSYQDERAREADSLLRPLTLFVRSLSPIPEIKTLILFSEGFSRNPSSDTFDVATVALGPRVANRMMPLQDFRIERGLEDLTEAAAAARVSIFTVNPGAGSRSASMSARRQSPLSESKNPTQIDVFRRAEMNFRQSLVEIAEATGGKASESPEVLKALQEVVDLAPGLYTVGYTPEGAGDGGGMHSVRIRIKRKGVEVRTRREIPLPAVMPPLTGSLTVAPDVCSPEGRRPVVMTLRLDRARLVFQKVEKLFSANFSLYLRVIAEDRSDPLHQDYRFFNITNSPEEIAAGGLPDPALALTLIVPCRALTVLATVTDANSGGSGEFSAALAP